MKELTIVRGACPHDCPDTCAMLYHVKGGKFVDVTGDPDHPMTGLCVKVNNFGTSLLRLRVDPGHETIDARSTTVSFQRSNMRQSKFAGLGGRALSDRMDRHRRVACRTADHCAESH